MFGKKCILTDLCFKHFLRLKNLKNFFMIGSKEFTTNVSNSFKSLTKNYELLCVFQMTNDGINDFESRASAQVNISFYNRSYNSASKYGRTWRDKRL